MQELFKRNKMFRRLLAYQFFSSIGGAMFRIFILLSVHLLYHNPIYTGIAGFLMATPAVFSFAVGPIVDRRNKVTIMRLTTLLEVIVLSLLAFSPLQELLGVGFMFAVIFAYSIAALFESPAGNAMLPQIVEGEKIIEANSMVRIVAMVGALIISVTLFLSLQVNVSFSFIYGLSAAFLAVAFIASLFLRDPRTQQASSSISISNYAKDLKEGARFIRDNVLIYLLIVTTAMSLFAEIASINRPMFLEYHIGAHGYILFVMLVLVGGIIASSTMGKIGNKFKLSQFVIALLVFTGTIRIIFVYVLPISVVSGAILMIASSTFFTGFDIITGTLNQKIPPKDMVGRVSTLSATFRSVFVTIGALLGGFLGSVVPVVDYIFIFHGISYIALAIYMAFVPSIRALPRMSEVTKADAA